jgi:hypothetical protein
VTDQETGYDLPLGGLLSGNLVQCKAAMAFIFEIGWVKTQETIVLARDMLQD